MPDQKQYIKKELKILKEKISDESANITMTPIMIQSMEFYYLGKIDALRDILSRLEDDLWDHQEEVE